MTMKVVTTGRGRGRGRGGSGSGAARGRGRGGGYGGKMLTSTPAPATGAAAATALQATAPVSRATTRPSASATPAPKAGARLSTTPASRDTTASSSGLKLRLSVRAGSGSERALSNTPVFDENAHGEPEKEAGPEHEATLFKGGEVVAEDTAEPDSDGDLPTEDVDTGARRSGRAVKKVRHEDYDYGSEEHQSAEKEAKQKGQDSSQPPSIHVLQLAEPTTKTTTTKRGRPPKTLPNATPSTQVSLEHVLSPPPPPSPVPQNISELHIDPKIFEIVNHLKSTPGIVTELPELYDDWEKVSATPYTATQLMHIYLTAHKLQLWNTCDLIADTWIRAFHTQRRRDARVASNERLWRRNRVLEKRLLRFQAAKKAGKTPDEPLEFENDAPEYHLSVSDPALDTAVLSFDSTLLGELYAHTPSTCGARRLWADAMALAGDKAARMFVQSESRGFRWDEEMKGDVMKTSLRMLRRKITLKIEESSEGAWCERYHEHGEGECYRKAAARWVEDRSESVVQDGDEGNGGGVWSSDEDSDGMEEIIRKGLEEEERRDAKRRRLE